MNQILFWPVSAVLSHSASSESGILNIEGTLLPEAESDAVSDGVMAGLNALAREAILYFCHDAAV